MDHKFIRDIAEFANDHRAIVEIGETSTGRELKHIGAVFDYSPLYTVLAIDPEREEFQLIHNKDITFITFKG